MDSVRDLFSLEAFLQGFGSDQGMPLITHCTIGMNGYFCVNCFIAIYTARLEAPKEPFCYLSSFLCSQSLAQCLGYSGYPIETC